MNSFIQIDRVHHIQTHVQYC